MFNKEKTTNENEKQSNNGWCLYSVSDGKLMQHKIQFANGGSSLIASSEINATNFYKELTTRIEFENSKLQEEPKLTKTNCEYGVTEFSVLKIETNENKLSLFYHYLAVGKFDGSVEIFRSNSKDNIIERVCSFFNHQKLITCLKWNKSIYKLSDTNSKLLLASGSNDFNIIIIDFKNVIEEYEEKNNQDSKFISKFLHKLCGHKERITALSWSVNSTSNLVASCSYDSTVQIWNADTGKPLVNYRGHSDKLLCGIFSNQNSNLFYSGGEDYCLHKWQIDAQSEIMPPEECKRNLSLKNLLWMQIKFNLI